MMSAELRARLIRNPDPKTELSLKLSNRLHGFANAIEN